MVCGVQLLLEPIFACAFLGIVEVFNCMLENRTRNGWWWCCISEAHFCMCDFEVFPLFLPLVIALGFAFATCFMTLQTRILGFSMEEKIRKTPNFIPYKKLKMGSGKLQEIGNFSVCENLEECSLFFVSLKLLFLV